MEDVDAAFDSYLEVWEALDEDEILPYFNKPTVLISPQFVMQMPDESAFRNVVAAKAAQLRGANYRRRELRDRETKVLAETLAMVSGTLCDLNEEGTEFDRTGASYTFIASDGAWRIGLIAGSAVSPSGVASSDSEGHEVVREVDAVLDSWFAAWESPDFEKIAPYFNVPMAFVLPAAVIFLADAAAIRNLIAPIVGQRIAESYRRTDYRRREAKALSESLAIVSGTEVAFNSEGSELRRSGMTYTLVRSAETWRICAVASYPAE